MAKVVTVRDLAKLQGVDPQALLEKLRASGLELESVDDDLPQEELARWRGNGARLLLYLMVAFGVGALVLLIFRLLVG